MRPRFLLAGLVAGALLAVAVGSVAGGARNDRPQTGAELYSALESAAAAGDERAAAYVAALDRYLQERNLSVDALALPNLDNELQAARGLLRLSTTDRAPWEITVTNQTPIDTAAQLDRYVAARAAALIGMAEREPTREVEVVVSPARKLSLADLAAALECPCPTNQLIVDVYSADGWLMTAARPGDGLDFAENAISFEESFREQIAVSLDLFPDLSPDDVEFEVRSARLLMTASAAANGLKRDEVLLVDPLSDLSDAYAGRAAVINVENPPDIREAHARLVLDEPVDAEFVEPGGNK